MQLSWYINDSRTLLHDNLGLLINTEQITRWINEARRQVAYQAGCINLLATGLSPFGNAAQPGVMVPGGGTPGSRPVNSFQTIVNQEKYPFSMATERIQADNAGIDYVLDVTSIAISWGSMRPAMEFMPWEDLQAFARSYNYLVSSFPLKWSTDGDGANANLWMWPVPSTVQEMEWQCSCSPAALVTDSDFDAIPHPFENAVKYYVAYLSYLSTMRPQLADLYLELFMTSLRRGRSATDRGRVAQWYSY